MYGYLRLLDPHGVSLLCSSVLSSGQPNILPSRTFSDAFDTRNVDGNSPDSRLIVKLREDDGV